MLQEFREFIARGNVMDMAVGIIVGAAFTAIVTSLVGDLINPIIAIFTGGIDFSGWFYVLGDGQYASLEEARTSGEPVFAVGAFLMAVINFLIVAFAVFMLVKMVNRIKQATERKAQEEATAEEPAGPSEKEILIEIRDALRGRAV
ncbi:large conductance mechanosensitive channel protein MscL [Roseitranquillus sediminis]|uniref:large conductance mechanosensitive channel protein MscL n=1 Tax=Roseitranquillus sediminis TaxID=2809051 RepID=UPI001D0CCF19|nr:large conductance mechanosensitive channel protein MscL [Roseitranquillus sediminis]MBM9593280.1 large conductance mechanosensitive channel protein MscL [Roseitranquillus sediminis]